MIVHRSKVRLPRRPISRSDENTMLAYLDKKLGEVSSGRTQYDRLDILNSAIVASFKRYGIGVQFAGVYAPRLKDPLTTGPIKPTFGKGCPIIPLSKGVIGFSVINRTSYLVPSTNTLEAENPNAHWDCRTEEEEEAEVKEKVDLTELVVAKVAQNGSYPHVPLVYDLDLIGANSFSERGSLGLIERVDPMLDVVLKRSRRFELTPWVHYLPFNGEACPIQ